MNNAARKRPDLAAFSDWASELAQTFVSLASDIALIVDRNGVITSVAQAQGRPFASAPASWVGQAWVDTVTGETRAKVELLLKEVAAEGLSRRREVNHPADAGTTIPVAYTVIRLGDNGPVLAVGRDLRAMAAIQQRFLDVQQDLERGYWQARQAESQAGLLAQVASDAVLVVDAATLLIVEVNPFASQLFDLTATQLIGRGFLLGFDRHSRTAVEALVTGTARSGKGGEIGARLAGRIGLTSVSATPLRVDDRIRLLVRVRLIDPVDSRISASGRPITAPGAVVITDSSGRVLMASAEFVSLVLADTDLTVIGRTLADWFDTSPPALASWMQRLRRDGVLRGLRGGVRTSRGSIVAVEWSAMLMPEGDRELVGFIVEPLPDEGFGRTAPADALRDAIGRLSVRIGSDALPALLESVTALAEQHFLDLALQYACGDPDAAARLLQLTPGELERRRSRPGESRPPEKTG